MHPILNAAVAEHRQIELGTRRGQKAPRHRRDRSIWRARRHRRHVASLTPAQPKSQPRRRTSKVRAPEPRLLDTLGQYI